MDRTTKVKLIHNCASSDIFVEMHMHVPEAALAAAS
jgi:hypothetical protein